MEIISRCRKERNRDIAKILLGGTGVMGLGIVLSANKKSLIQYALMCNIKILILCVVMGIMVYGHMTEGYGSCLFCLSQVPHSELAAQIRQKYYLCLSII